MIKIMQCTIVVHIGKDAFQNSKKRPMPVPADSGGA